MNNLKKLTALILSVVLAISFAELPVFASSYKDVDDSKYYAEAIESLTTYGIVSGFAGYFEPNAHVTRAEFAKMVTLVSGLEDEVYSNAGNRKFDDVSVAHWGNGYINTAAENKLIVGYPNGWFMPEKKITFAECVTVLLRAMNYTTADLGDNWPYAYMVKGKALGLTEGINIGDNSYIPRGDLAVVVNRALQTNLNGSSEKLISKMDIKMTDEVLLIATKNEDASLQADEIKTDAGIYKLAAIGLKFTPFTKVELVLNDDGKVINFNTTYTPKTVVTTIDSFVDGVVYFENGTSSRSLGVSNNTPVYNDGSITTYGNAKNSIEEGAAVSIVYDENGSVGYLLFGNANYTEAVAIRSDIYTALDSVGVSREQVDSATVIRNGESATLSDAQLYVVVYYLK
ncbi:MAG: S-layer homology domain-containing protein, partial [Clostridia bacterium]|nr:S-layer homology domain-containing protein [Clostridia bacterium]